MYIIKSIKFQLIKVNRFGGIIGNKQTNDIICDMVASISPALVHHKRDPPHILRDCHDTTVRWQPHRLHTHKRKYSFCYFYSWILSKIYKRD